MTVARDEGGSDQYSCEICVNVYVLCMCQFHNKERSVYFVVPGAMDVGVGAF